MKINLNTLALGSAMSLVLAALPANAQVSAKPEAPQSPNAEKGNKQSDVAEIVVTGSSIRGLIAPVGSPVLAVDREEVRASGATSTLDVLANIPQIRGFGTLPAGQASATQSFSIPTLRTLPNTQPGDGTLYLWNGNRMVGGGFNTRPDPAVVPATAIDRVDVVLGGGSAVYGSDAVAGTINFLVRKNLDGAELRGSYGFAHKFSRFNFAGAFGKVWDTGHVLISGDYSGHSNIMGRDRDYFTNDNRANGGTDFRLSSCPQANVTIGSTTYAYPALAAGTTNKCDPTDNTTLYPYERRWTVLASLSQEITPGLEFSFDGYYSRRHDKFLLQQTSASGTIRNTNPYWIAPAAAPTATSGRVAFNFASVFGDSLLTDQRFTTWQVVPSLKWNINDNWRAVATLNYGFGDGHVHADDVDRVAYAAALAGTTTATALNPYNLSQTNATVLTAIRNYNRFDNRDHKMLQTKLVVDGTLAHLPGGDVKMAVGGERYWEYQYSIAAAGPRGSEDPARAGGISSGDREVWSAFGELAVPLFGPYNARPGLASLILNISGRLDHYSDFGDTWNPKIAGTWKPIEDIAIRASYSTAFVAPSLNSMTKPPTVQVSASTTSALVPAGGATNRPQLTIQGGNPNLKPETAKTYDVGIDFTPSFAPGLKASLGYYHIDLNDVIAGPNPNLFYTSPGYTSFYLLNPTSLAQVQAFHGLGSMTVEGGGALEAFGLPQVIIDSRTANLGRVIVSGLDFALQFDLNTSIGTFTPAIAGTLGIKQDSATPKTAAFIDLFKNGATRDTFTASLNYRNGPLKARITWDRLGGFPVQNVTNQFTVNAFQTVNLSLGYEFEYQGIFSGTRIGLNLDNAFDAKPSYRNQAGGIGNGSTVGRMLNISLEKKF